MRDLSNIEVAQVGGADYPAMGPYEPPARPDGTACANTVMAWGGMGSTIGGALGGLFGGFGGLAGSFGGLAVGGGLAARISEKCKRPGYN